MGDQEILKLISYNHGISIIMVLVSRYQLTMITVPIIVVFTKYDELFARAAYDLKSTRGDNEGNDLFQKRCREKAWNDYETKCVAQIRKEMSFIHVSTSMSLLGLRQYFLRSSCPEIPETLENLVKTTIEHIKTLPPPERLVPVTDDVQHAGSPARKPWMKKLKERLLPGSHRNVQRYQPDTVQPDSSQAGGLSDSTRAGAAFATAQRIDMQSKINASIE